MTEIESMVRGRPGNLEHLNELRKAVAVELAASPFRRVDSPAATAEGAVYAILQSARLWSRSPRLVSLVTELETLARSFGPNGRLRGLRQLSMEAVAALLDEAPGGPAVARPVTLANCEIAEVGEPYGTPSLLTGRPPEDARLLGRLCAYDAHAGMIAGVAITLLPVADRVRLRAIFAAPDAPGRGDLVALKRGLDDVDKACVAAGAARAAVNLRIAFQIDDKRTDHRRGSTAATFLSPAPLARLALTVVDLVLPRDEPSLFLAASDKAVMSGDRRARYADQVRYIFAEILETAHAIAKRTPDFEDIDVFCGISVTRRASDLIAQVRSRRKNKDVSDDDEVEEDFDPHTTAARRLIENTMRARDTVLLLRAYEALFLAYTDAVLEQDPSTEIRAARQQIVRYVCNGLLRRYRLARADLEDGIYHWTDIKHRATGSAQPRRWLPLSVVAAPALLTTTLFVPIMIRPSKFSVLDEIVGDFAVEFDGLARKKGRPDWLGDSSRPIGSTLCEAWATLKAAYPPEDVFSKKYAA